jgi:hypothetical protein
MFADAVTNGNVNISGLSEASGVAASRDNDNVLWTHNDSGHPANVYAIDTQGRLLGTYGVPGNTDNEDIAIGPGPVTNVNYLYVGDIGDNNLVRQHIKVYQIPEPAIYARDYTNPVSASSMKGARTITLTYPDGTNNAESMFVDPVSGDLWILTKASSSRVYTASKSQLDTNDSFALTFVRTLAFSTLSAADISPSGNEIIVRRESFAQLWQRSAGQSVSNAFGGTAIDIPVQGVAGGEPNGEAIGFDSIGNGYFTLSDSATVQPLRYFRRTSFDGPIPWRSLVGAGSSWKYLDDGSDHGTAWRLAGFDDSAWKGGLAQFGYGDGDEKTLVSYGGDAAHKYVTTYFRKSFILHDVAAIANLRLKMVVDDGAVVYLNGTPVVYEGLGPGAAYNTLAGAMPVALQAAWHSYVVDPALLVNGTNLLAAEVHQSSPSGTNISFDLQLVASGPATFYEPLAYPEGTALSLVTNLTGQWWTTAGSGSAVATTIAGNLSVPGLERATGVSVQFGAVDGPSGRFNLISNVTSGTLYYSCTLKVTALGDLSSSGGYVAGLNNSRGSQTGTPTVLGTRILMRATASGGFNIGVAKNTTTPAEWVWSSREFRANDTVFLVGSYTFNSASSSDDISRLWIDPAPPDLGADTPPPATLTANSGADISANQIASFVFLQRGLNNTAQPGTLVADELRIGPTWASVTAPTPILLTPSWSAGDGFACLLAGMNGGSFVLQSSSNLHDWFGLQTNTSGSLQWAFQDQTATNSSHRFYRALAWL